MIDDAYSKENGHVASVEVVIRVHTHDGQVLEGVASDWPQIVDVEDARVFDCLDKAAGDTPMSHSQRLLLLLLGRLDGPDSRILARAYRTVSAALRRHESGVLGDNQ